MSSTSAQTREVVEGFLADRLGHWLAHDVVVHDLIGPGTTTGRAAAVLVIDRLLRGPSSASLADVVVVADETAAAARWVLELDPPESTGLVVRLPMAAIFEVDGGEIVTLDLLYDPRGPGSSATAEGAPATREQPGNTGSLAFPRQGSRPQPSRDR